MCRNNREDIFNLVPINIISSKFHVKVIGGGKAATIKVKGLLEKGCYVHILSKEFSKEILDIENKNLKLKKGNYYKEFIKDGHLIIILRKMKYTQLRYLKLEKKLKKKN